MGGFIKFYRMIINDPTWKNFSPEQKVILITLMCMVNYAPNTWMHKGKTYTVKAGQVVTSISSIMEKCGSGISVQNVRTALKRFKNLGIIKDETLIKNYNRVITIINWQKYQNKYYEKSTVELTDVMNNDLINNLTNVNNAETFDTLGDNEQRLSRLTDNPINNLTNEVNTIKEIKELKENILNQNYKISLFNQWWDLYDKKISKKKCEQIFIKILDKYSFEEIMEGTKCYLQYLKETNTYKQYQKNPLTFLKGENWKDEYKIHTEEKPPKLKYFTEINLD